MKTTLMYGVALTVAVETERADGAALTEIPKEIRACVEDLDVPSGREAVSRLTVKHVDQVALLSVAQIDAEESLQSQKGT
jgi:hypothetical protein